MSGAAGGETELQIGHESDARPTMSDGSIYKGKFYEIPKEMK